MEFIPIFANKYDDDQCKIWCVKYPGMDFHEVRRLMNLWKDQNWLSEHFTSQNRLLNSIYGGLDKVSAMATVTRERLDIFSRLVFAEDQAQVGNFMPLNNLFEALSDGEKSDSIGRKRVKAKSNYKPKLVRFYGVSLEENQILLCGGGIKLVEKMQDCPFLTEELKKLNSLKQYVKNHQIHFLG